MNSIFLENYPFVPVLGKQVKPSQENKERGQKYIKIRKKKHTEKKQLLRDYSTEFHNFQNTFVANVVN